LLESVGITCNKNAIPYDPQKPAITSGIRLGTPAATTRGFGAEEWRNVGQLIGDVLDGITAGGELDQNVANQVRLQVRELTNNFPIYTHLLG
jgi:glycine hydroxymethyltransferase